MSKIGLSGNAPIVRVAPAPTDRKRMGQFMVNDIFATISQLNKQIDRAAMRAGIVVELAIDRETESTKVVLISAVRAGPFSMSHDNASVDEFKRKEQ